MVSLEELKKLELRIATVDSVEDHPNADRLYVLKISINEEKRQLVAGLKQHYTPEQLIGKQIVVVANLEPAVLRGVESQGMLLAAGDDETVAILTPEHSVKSGSTVR